MECEDKSMERQKLVQNDEEEEITTLPTSVTTQSKTPISPPNVYSGSDSHSGGGKTNSEAKLSYVNERKSVELENARKASTERKKKMLKDSELISSSSDNNSCTLLNLKRDDSVDIEMHDKPISISSQKSHIPSLPLPSTSHQYPLLIKATSKSSISSSLQNFASRKIKHHTFDNHNQGFQDVKNMEKNLIKLLDDFHNGKLRAFSGSSMNQMKNIRDQQEKLSKLHFDLGTVSNDSKSSDNHMAELVNKLNEISHSIEKLNSFANVE